MSSPPSQRRWPRDAYTEAVWSSSLTSTQRLVALAYADHARDADTAWIAPERLEARTGLGRTAAKTAVRALVDAGWLVLVEAARQHRAPRYRLVPQPVASRHSDEAQGVASRPPEGVASRHADRSRVSPRGARVSADGAQGVASRHRPEDLPEDLPPQDAAAQPAPAETEGQRVNRLTRTYTDVVRLSSFGAVAGVVRKAVRAGTYTDDAITAALARLAVDGRSVTANTLRIELEGRPRAVGNFGVSYGDDSRALPARTMTGDEWIAESRTLRSNQGGGTYRGGPS